MDIDKSRGYWTKGSETTYLDDLAYYMYCQYRKNKPTYNLTSQDAMMVHPKVYRRFYNEALIIIRREKLNKIITKI